MLRKSILLFLLIVSAFALQDTSAPASRVADPFATGWMLVDTNGDGIADFIQGRIVVPAQPTAAENAAAANLAARLGYGATGLTLPLVVTSAGDSGAGPRVWVGRGSVPAALAGEAAALANQLAKEE